MSLTQNENKGELLEKISYLDNFDLVRIAQTAWENRWVVLLSAIAPAALIIILSVLVPIKYESIAVVDVTGKTMKFIDNNKKGLPFKQDENPVLEVAKQNRIKLEGEIPEAKISFRKISPIHGAVTIKIIDRQPQTARRLAKALADYFVKRAKKVDPNRIEHALTKKNEARISNLLSDKIKLLKTQSAELSKEAMVLRNSISALSQAERETRFAVMLNDQLVDHSSNLRAINLTLLDSKSTLESTKLEQAKRTALLGTIERGSISKPRRIKSSVLFNAIFSGLMVLSIVSIALDFRGFLKEHRELS